MARLGRDVLQRTLRRAGICYRRRMSQEKVASFSILLGIGLIVAAVLVLALAFV
ncbi:hypothetical protein [Bradyrhizobium sp.]|uniref:hypothetical protein n=1 Tax=Bradyrhizobium sp. TaxID=376 RepID=UPI004037A44C